MDKIQAPKYLGVKLIMAVAMNRLDYNLYRGWDLPSDEDGSDEGFLVEYIDGGQSNHPDHAGYISWSPADVFSRAYKPVTGLNFGDALAAMKVGLKVTRQGWNGKDMFVFRVPGSTFAVNRAPLLGIYPESTEIQYRTHYDMKTVDGQIVPWICSQSDMDEEDWEVVD